MLLDFSNDPVVMVQKHVIDSDEDQDDHKAPQSSYPRGSISEYDSSSCDEGELQLSQASDGSNNHETSSTTKGESGGNNR